MRRPWGPIVAAVAALVFAIPTLFLPADSQVSVKLVFIVAGAILLAASIVLTRAEPGARNPGVSEPDDDVTP